MKKILVTGSSGFIGMHICKKLLNQGHTVLGIDNMNTYYDVKLKISRLDVLRSSKNFFFKELDISSYEALEKVFKEFTPHMVVNLAAQAGVRYSIENPHSYIESNIKGFMNILECCRYYNTEGLIYASSSSVYGKNEKLPFSENDNIVRPISIYAATKISNELMAHTYSHLYGLNTTGLRFFTVYGPWGRPDMAMYIFANKIIEGTAIPIFNNGEMKRDFTYIDDVVEGINSSINKNYSCEIFNLGNNKIENLMDMISLLEEYLGKKANLEFLPMQPGDVKKTYADIDHSIKKLNYEPVTSIKVGVPNFVKWYKEYHKN